MATSLHQLFDNLTRRTAAHAAAPAAVEDAAGALAHTGRALHRLAADGLDYQVGGPREQVARQLAAACHTAAPLWSPTGGPLTDLMGAAADVTGRAAPLIGRAERWAVAVEFSAAADRAATLIGRRLPLARIIELADLARSAAAVEQAAQAGPPDAPARAALDRLIPRSEPLAGVTGAAAAAESAAALVTAIAHASGHGGLSLREFRAVLAASELTSRYAAAVAAELPDHDGEGPPGRAASVAWQVTRAVAMTFDDGRWIKPTDTSPVAEWAAGIRGGLAHDIGPPTAMNVPAVLARRDLPEVLAALQQTANQLPVLADQLTGTIHRWAAEGTLRAYAADLPRREDMPAAQAREVVAGHRIMAAGTDLDRLAAAITRAGPLSTALAYSLNRAAAADPPTQPHLAAAYAARVTAPGAAEHLRSTAREVEQALAATRLPFQSSWPSKTGATLDR